MFAAFAIWLLGVQQAMLETYDIFSLLQIWTQYFWTGVVEVYVHYFGAFERSQKIPGIFEDTKDESEKKSPNH